MACTLWGILLLLQPADAAGSVPAVADAEAPLDLSPNPGPERLPPPAPWKAWVSLGLVGGIVLVSVALIWRRRRAPAAASPPAEQALAALDHLAANHAMEPSRAIEAVMHILRRYLDRQFNLPALERTTQELFALLRQRGPWQDEQLKRLQLLFDLGDLVRYAGAEPAEAERDALIAAVRQFVVAVRDAGTRTGSNS